MARMNDRDVLIFAVWTAARIAAGDQPAGARLRPSRDWKELADRLMSVVDQWLAEAPSPSLAS
jgi:hypothetical protein